MVTPSEMERPYFTCVINGTQLQHLRKSFNVSPYTTFRKREQLAEVTRLSTDVILVWFQNERIRAKEDGETKVSQVPLFDDILIGVLDLTFIKEKEKNNLFFHFPLYYVHFIPF